MDDAHRDPTSNPSNSENPDNHDSRFAGLERTAELIVRYHDDDLSDAELAELRASLKHNASARDLFVRWGLQMQAMAEALNPQYREGEADSPGMALGSEGEQNYAQLLSELAQLEASAEVVTLAPGSAEDVVVEDADDPNALSARDFIAVGGYLIAKGLRTKVAAYAAVAALIVLGVVLFNPFNGPSQPDGPIAKTPELDEQPVVATLTATHHAIWAEGALVDGARLQAGDRLTLTEGFAEITTNDGAVAILEAPATIQLLDKNALRLLSGKLVGICETESSKGLLVRTSHMDITDLGTRFGVDAAEPDVTRVLVYQGSIQATSLTGGPQSAIADLRLTSGQAAEASAANPSIQRITYDTTRLAKIGPTTKALPGTGLGLAVGDTDPNWRIVAINGKPLASPRSLSVHPLQEIYARPHPNDPATSQWLSWLPTRRANDGLDAKTATYRFQTQIELPESFDPSTDQIVARFMADDQMQAIFVNGQAIPVPYQKAQDDRDAWFKEVYEIVIDSQLVSGRNTIEFVVLNKFAFKDYVGLRVAWELQDHSQGITLK